MKTQDLRKKKPEELEKLLADKNKELFNLRSASLAGEDSQKKKGQLKTTRRTIAKIKTLLNSQ